ncbi:MAG: hypothetical protein U0V02_07125 [Anaerolineales bacterium]
MFNRRFFRNLIICLAIILILGGSFSLVPSQNQTEATKAWNFPSDNTALWISALSTFIYTILTVIVAGAAYQTFKRERKKPELWIDIKVEPPDCTLMTSMAGTYKNGKPKMASTFWFRACVGNKGNIAAEDVEVLIHDLAKYENGVWNKVEWFIQSNLSWTHLPRENVFLPMIMPGTKKNFELGYIPCLYDSKNNPIESLFVFSLTILPTYRYDVLYHGEYEFSITSGAKNSEPITQRFRLWFSGTWYKENDTMFSDGISIKVIR